MQPTTVVIAGPQGSGKGTQVALLKQFLEKLGDNGVVHAEAGAAFRRIAESKSYASTRIAEIINAGKLLPDVVPVYTFTRELFENLKGGEHILLEGFSRKPIQAEMIDDLLTFFGRTPYNFLVLDVPKEESLSRLSLRAKAEGRADDASQEAILRRLDLYHDQIGLVTDVFTKRGQNVLRVDGVGSVEEIHQRILAALKLA